MKILAIILINLILAMPTMAATKEQAQIIEVSGCGISNNKAYIKTTIKGHKITLRSPKLSKSKYLKLVNVAL